jgi:hypothetical protein
MKKRYLVCAVAASLLFAGCSTVKQSEVKASDQISRIEVTVDSDRHVRITNAQALQDENTVKVSGTLRPKSSTTRMAGHVHVSLIDAGGDVVLRRTVEPSTKAFFRRSNLNPHFNQIFKLETSTVSSVLLKHHTGSVLMCHSQ